MIAYGLKISKPGKDVLTASGRDLIYNSDKKYLFIQKQGIVKTGENKNIPHALGYFGTGFVWGDDNSNNFYFGDSPFPNAPLNLYSFIDNYQIRIFHGGSSVGDEIYYMVFNEPVNI